MRARHAIAVALVGAALLPGCSLRGLSLVQDRRVEIIEPAENATVSLPLAVAWTVEDFDGYFALFFDRAPMRPNQSLRDLVPEDDPCRAVPGCPDAEWLADRHIYVTDRTELVIERLPDIRVAERTKLDRHDLVIVLLDESGRRIGESAFTREFIVDRAR